MTKSAPKDLIDKVDAFLKSTETEIAFDVTCPDHLCKAVEAAGGKVSGDAMDTNGWQYDWWIKGDWNGVPLLLSGCGYYGDGKIEKNPEG